MRSRCIGLGILLLLVFAATNRADVTSSDFGKSRDNTPVQIFTITNTAGASARVMTYGATLVSLKMPDRAGEMGDIVLGFDTLDGYFHNNPFFGATVGRYANRIRAATFSLDGVNYKLIPNDHGNTLHGGRRGFDKVVWDGAKIDAHSVEFTYISKDGEEGFPGTLKARVKYSLSDANELQIDYSATTDKKTVVNLTNHSYFNLAGAGNGDVLEQELSIDANQFTPTDSRSIPTGRLQDVVGTPFDFREPHKIGQRIAADNEQIRFVHGYDQNFVLNKKDGLHHAATVYDPTSGRAMEIMTTEPGIQLYSANGLDGTIAGKDGKAYVLHGAICLEPQHFPDSPNHPEFPSALLKPGDTYQSQTIYKFSTRSAGPASAPSTNLATGWKLLEEGHAEGTIEQDAKHPTNSSPHILRIVETKMADPGDGRVGAISDVHFAVFDGEWCDVTFSAVTERLSIGLVFSLENDDGKVLARTTLPEVGGRRRGRNAPTTAPAVWNRYLVSLHARASDSNVHMVITPIEPTTGVWIDGLKLTPRLATK